VRTSRRRATSRPGTRAACHFPRSRDPLSHNQHTTSYTNQALLAASHLALDGASALGHAGVAAAGEGENQEGGEGEENGEELHCEELVVGCGG
jgi:hypothetical protein